MKMTRHILLTLIALALPLAASAQMKVYDRSSKRAPEWVNTAIDDYLIVSASGTTMQEAMQKALNEVTEQIIRAVANNVTVRQTNTMSETVTGSGIESSDVYTYLSSMNSANLPFLKGITLSKAEESYWEKLRDKRTGEERVDYWVKYPFPSWELDELIEEFEAIDAAKVREFEAIKSQLPSIASVEQIGRNIASLDALAAYFFDDVRSSEVQSLKQQYTALYGSLTVSGTTLDDGRYRCTVMLEGRPVSISTKPKVTSNCASGLDVEADNGAFIISYDDSDCLPDEENYVEITFRIAGKRLVKRHLLDAADDAAMSVVPEGRLYLTTDTVDGRTLHNVTLRMTINNLGGTPFGLKSVELTLPDIPAPLVFDDIDKVYEAKGTIQVVLVAKGRFEAAEKRSGAFTFAQGAMVLADPTTGTLQRVRIYLPYETNWDNR